MRQNRPERHQHQSPRGSFDTPYDRRQHLLSFLPWFVGSVVSLPGIRQVSLLGSIVTNKPTPKDIDLLIVVGDDLDLERLASLGRRLKGRAQQNNQGADIFLSDLDGHYIGRICRWRECRPGIRASCPALHCGKRQYLNDDLQIVKLSDKTVQGSLQLWPVLERRPGLPADLTLALKLLESDMGRP